MKVDSGAKPNISSFISELGLSVRATNVLLYMNLKSAAELMALDAETLLRKRNCGRKTAAEIMEAVVRHTPPVKVAPAKEMDPVSELAAMEHIPVTDLQLSVRALGGLARLNISTLRQLAEVPDRELLRLWNFGKGSLREVRLKLELLRLRGFVLWPTAQGTTGGLSRRITAAARKVQRFRNSAGMLRDDPRFGHLIREIRPDAKNARQAAEMIVSRKVDPVYPPALMLRLTDLLGALEAANSMSVEAELWSLTDGLGTERDRQIIVSHLGWDGTPPRTFERVSHLHKMTRERVRQICVRIEKVRSSKPFAPALDRALKAVTRAAPTLAEDIESQLIQKRLTKTGFCVESLAAAAHHLGRQPRFGIELFHGDRVVVPANADDFLDRIDQVARNAIRHWGVATVEDMAAGAGTPVALTKSILALVPGFEWLDQASGWFWIENQPRNSLLTQIGKILAACPRIDVGELRTGVGRHHRRKGFAPPKRVLLV